MISAVGKRILIQPLVEQKSALILTNQKPSKYLVCSIGDEVTKVKPGNIIYTDKIYGTEIEHEGNKYLVIEEMCILAKLD
jgi:co-chaperonin GroES (HSP10)